MNKLFLPIKIQCRHSPYLIRVEHERLEIESDLEMTAHVRLVYYTNDNGAFGEPVLNVIRNNPDLSDSQKRHDMERFKTIRWSSTTRGAMVDPETGITVPPNKAGQYPEGSITQLQYWQMVSADIWPGSLLSEKVYAAILKNMEEIYDRQNI